jgi:hypothetical protein
MERRWYCAAGCSDVPFGMVRRMARRDAGLTPLAAGMSSLRRWNAGGSGDRIHRFPHLAPRASKPLTTAYTYAERRYQTPTAPRLSSIAALR